MKKNKLPSLVAILILTLITSVMWISFSVYRALTTETPLKISKTILEPLNPSLDEETIGQIESKIFLNESQIPENIISAPQPQATQISSPTPTPMSTPTASPSAEPTP